MIISFLGTGLLGSAFVKSIQSRGFNVQVWNRTLTKALHLENEHIKCLPTPAEAIAGATYIHLALKDDASVDEVLALAQPKPGQIVIDHTTTSKDGCIKRTSFWASLGVQYQHAPVFMGPANALNASGYMLISGSRSLVASLNPYLSAMTGKLLDLGDETGKAAAMKLAGNAFLVCFTFGLREAMGVAKSLDLQSSDLQFLFSEWNPASMTANRLERLSRKEHVEPSWELSMARKDTGLFLDAAVRSGLNLTLLPEIAEVMDVWIRLGFGHHDWTVVGHDFR